MSGRRSASVALAAAVLALLAQPPAHAARCSTAGLSSTRIVDAACPDLDRDGRRDLVVVTTRERWIAFVRDGRKLDRVGRGRAKAALRGPMRVAARRHAFVLTLPVRVTRACRLDARRTRTLKLRRGRLKVTARRLRVLGACPQTPPTSPLPPSAPAPPAPEKGAPPPPGPPLLPRTCRNTAPGAPVLPVTTRDDLPPSTPGRVLPGTDLASQAPPHGQDFTGGETEPHYPASWTPQAEPTWGAVAGASVRAADGSVFNGSDAVYRAAHDYTYFGVSPISVGDIDGDGIDDLATTAHWATVDGEIKRGEVHLWFGRRGADRLDPRRDVPDVVVYGHEAQGRLGIEVAPAGDFNADGFDDVLISAAFVTARRDDGSTHADGGEAYLLYGGFLDTYACPVKVRAEEIGVRVPGLRIEGGHDGTRRLGWTNMLDSGDLDGDGDAELVLGAADPNRPFAYPPFRARAYVLYGGTSVPRSGRFRLGVGDPTLEETVIEMPEPGSTLGPTRFQPSFVGDLDDDGDEELSIAGGSMGGRGELHLFSGRDGGLPRGVVPVTDSDAVIAGDDSDDGRIAISGLSGARPAGDVDGDGFPDVQVSARSARVDDRVVGAVAVLRGGPDALTGRRGFMSLDAIVVGDGPDVTSIGMPGMNTGADLDGDGHADLILNDPYWYEPVGGDRQVRGRVWVIRGGPDLPALRTITEAADLTILADTRFPGLLGYQWNTGDFDGDGRPDLVIADHYLGDTGRHDRPGGVYVLYNGIDFDLG